MGSEVSLFEKDLSNYFGRPAICVVNGTAAVHLALQCAGIGPGDEVLVPSLTYVATFQAISATGATPIACDVNLSNLTLSPSDVNKKVTSSTKAIVPVHFAGGVGEIDQIINIASKYNLRVIEDAAHAFGTTHNGNLVGSFGDITCFSFDGIKNITSGEGGCIVSDDPIFLQLARDARLLGVHNDSQARERGSRTWEFDVTHQGWRYHMSDLMAAIGRVQLSRFHSFATKRRSLAVHYNSLISTGLPFRSLPLDYEFVVPHIFPIVLDEGVDRASIRSHLERHGIQTGIHYFPNHLLSFYSSNSNTLPNTESISPLILSLPLHVDLEFSDINFIVDKLISYFT